MFETLSGRLKTVFDQLRRRGRLGEADVDTALREVRLALLEADVHFAVVKAFLERVRARAVGAEVSKALNPAQQVLKVVQDELVTILGAAVPLNLSGPKPRVIMLVGLQGSGKTTVAAKLGQLLRSNGERIMLAACDIYRPAAIAQLQQLAQRIDVQVEYEVDLSPLELARRAADKADKGGFGAVILDTAGRSQLDPEMMAELRGMAERTNTTIAGNTTLASLSEGSHTVAIYASDTFGNMGTSQTVYFTVALPDIAVVNMTISKTVVSQGFPFNMSVTLANNGESNETFNVTTKVNQTIIGEIYNLNLTSGNSIILSFTWNTTGFAYGNYTISAYAWPVLGETNTANNNFTDGVMKITIPGDINGDFKVTLTDLVILANSYSSRPGDARWDPNADIDSNATVGLTDLTILAIHYGQHYP